MRKKVFSAVILAYVLFFISCSSPSTLCQSKWQAEPVTVDGKLTEWQVPLEFYDEGTKLNFVISNDDSNLYYWIRITDDKEQIRIMRAGMVVWIDTTGKNQHQVGIQFPLTNYGSIPGEGGNKKQGSHGSSDSAQFKSANKWTGKLNQMVLTGFHFPIGGLTQTLNPYGIKVNIARDSSGVSIYEACIPFKTFYKANIASMNYSRLLGITMVINPMPANSHQGGSRTGGGGRYGGGGGGMGGGGMGGSRHMNNSYRSNNEDDSYNLSSTTLKLLLRLAVNK